MFEDSIHAEPVGTRVSSVSEFVLHVRETVEAYVPLSWIRGELSNLARPASGHLYFTLKDERAQIRCTMWRNRAQLLAFQPTEGMQVELRALATVYEARGDLQLNVETMRRAGAGSLYEAFLRLKAKLEAEGLFAAERKRPIPQFPRRVGIVTSPAGAVLHDIASAFARRSPITQLIVYPTNVQGSEAPAQIANAIARAAARADEDGLDALIVCRGGGSIEDLWGFNSEQVVRAIADSPIPVISGVGHETDVTLCDFVADQRAATPTAAAELLSAHWWAASDRLVALSKQLRHRHEHRFRALQQCIDTLQGRLQAPSTRIARQQEHVVAIAKRLNATWIHRHNRLQLSLARLRSRLQNTQPNVLVEQQRLATLQARIARAWVHRVDKTGVRLGNLASHLEHLNPVAVLQRGYAIVRTDSGDIVRQAQGIKPGDALHIQLASGELSALVQAQPTTHKDEA